MARFYLIRHGEKQHDDLMVGRMPGVHLTRAGQAQARRLATHLRRLPITRILSSPLERAIETVAPLARAVKLSVELTPAFGEIDMGEWTGLKKSAVERTKKWQRFISCSVSTSIPGGETLAIAQSRIASEIIRLSEKQPGAHYIVGTHEDLIRLAVCYFIGAPIEAYEHITIRSGSITLLTFDHRGVILELLDALPPTDPRVALR